MGFIILVTLSLGYMSNVTASEMDILILLLDYEWLNVRQIREKISFGEGATRTARLKLLNKGFIEERMGPNKSFEMNLTEKGKRAALALREVRELSED